jgi:hypothetical protein
MAFSLVPKRMMFTKKRIARVLLDSVSWFAASWLASLLRFDGQLPPEMDTQIFRFGILAVVISFLVFAFLPSHFMWSNLGLRESATEFWVIITFLIFFLLSSYSRMYLIYLYIHGSRI